MYEGISHIYDILWVQRYVFFLKLPNKLSNLWKTIEKNIKIHKSQIPLNSYDTPSVVHRSSIDTPSKRWTIDGLSMEYRWSIYLGKAEKQRTFLLGKSAVCIFYNKTAGLNSLTYHLNVWNCKHGMRLSTLYF